MSEKVVNIHVLEPDTLFLKILFRTLEELETDFKIHIHAYADGYEFIEKIKPAEGLTIYIISDALPKKNSIEVTRHIRSFDESGVIYVMTRANTEADMIYSLNAGVDNYFTKPFNLNLFQALIKRRIIRGGMM